jgi:sugar (pentulose or hexulose) kinase
MSPLVKLLWFREHAPDVWRRAAHWVGIKDYVLFRLTGVLAVDESTASATGLPAAGRRGTQGVRRRGHGVPRCDLRR